SRLTAQARPRSSVGAKNEEPNGEQLSSRSGHPQPYRHTVVITSQRPPPSVAVVAAAASPRILVAQVTKRYAQALPLDHVTVTIEPGEFVAVIGRSGAGKTTLLRCLAGTVPVTDGAIRVGDWDLTALTGSGLQAHRARVGMVFQQFNLVKRLRVL